MDRYTFIANTVLALALYVFNGLLGKAKSKTKGYIGYDSFGFNKVSSANFADHFFQKIVHPSILVAIAAAVLQYYGKDNIAQKLFLVVPIYWFFRILHIILWNLFPFTNWKYEIISIIISLLLGEGTLFLIIRPLLNSNEPIFIDATVFRDAFWIAALSYIAKLAWDISKASLTGYSVFPSNKREETIISRYNSFKLEYGADINVTLHDHYNFDDDPTKQEFLCLIYAIMIYEDHCRPCFIRHLEYLLKIILWNRTMSLGIMQVQTKTIITNRVSLKRAIDKLYTAYFDPSATDRLYSAIMDYNPCMAYYVEVISIFNILRSRLL